MTSSLFRDWVDPVTGVRSRVLFERVALIQLSFYFTNDGWSDDGRWLWFYAAHPPGGSAQAGRTLGLIDFEEDVLRWFPETQFSDASPFVDPVDGWVYWISGFELWRRGPLPNQTAERLNAFPETLATGRRPHRIATHLSRSADGRAFAVDALFGNETIVGLLPINGDKFEPWAGFNRCYNHAQMHPTDPRVMLIAQDWWHDPATGQRHDYEDRIWLLDAEAKLTRVTTSSRKVAHEWWDATGGKIWYVDYDQGTFHTELATGTITRVWPGGTCHSHATANGDLVVGDIGTYRWDQGVHMALADVRTNREIKLVSNFDRPYLPRERYHADPHPRFCQNDRYIIYSTTNLSSGNTLGIIATEEIRSALAKRPNAGNEGSA